MRNLRLAFRTLFKTPFVTVVAILSLALGIGANAAIYSLFNELLRAPLPVPHPEQLVNLGGNNPSPGSHQCGLAGNCQWVFSYRMFRDLEAQPGPFSGVAGHVAISPNVAFRGNTVNTSAELVSGSYFPVLGLKPALGRVFGLEDDRTLGAHPIVVLSHAYWKGQLGGDPSVVGQNITVNGQQLTIVGVAAPGFEGTTLGMKPDLFVPISMRAALGFGSKATFDDRRQYWIYLFARLRPGVSIEQASTQENVLYHRIINDVELPLQKGVSQNVLGRFKAKKLELTDGRRGLSSLHQQTQMPLVLLFGITLFVLAIACANIANLLLARAANRSLEMAVRLSLGATRRQLLAQLLTESVLLAVLGGLAGLAVAWATLRAIVVLLPADVSSTLSFSLSGPALAFAGLLSMTTGLLFGLFPALHSTRPNLVSALRDGSGKTSATRGAARFRASLVTAQIALSMALLVSAGLFIKSLDNVSRVSLGLDVDSLVTFRVPPALNGYPGPRSQQIFAQIEREVGAIPGVHGVAAARVPVLAGNNWDNDVDVQGFPHTLDTDVDAYYNAVGPDFFRIMGIPMVQGREFTASDVAGTPRVVIVNEAFTKKFKLGGDALGKLMGQTRDSLTHMIVGVVKDAKYSGVKQEDRPVFYMPYKQDTTAGVLTFYVRSSVPPKTLMPEIRSTIARIDRDLPLMSFKTMPQQIRDNVYLDRMITTLSAAFAALATLLAAIGLYGVLAYSVVQRTKEIGVRMALGADSSSIVAMVLRHVAVMTVVGAAVGAGGAYAIGKGAQSLLFGITARDPLVMAAATVVLALVALAAGSIPARRASRVDPVQALRYE
ncbi:MAG TPA: ABC transporter permease [Gemmatimonadaceae bacterium]|nr:ABC transporter permease [Gemmatimonadaceae bacterium]